MIPCRPAILPVFYVWLVLPSLVLTVTTAAADTHEAECMNQEDCSTAANLVCSRPCQKVPGKCVCRDGYRMFRGEDVCVKKVKDRSTHVTCETDEDCNRNEVCISWQYDPTLEYARILRDRLLTGADKPEKHQFCIDAWIIYNNHLEDLDEPRTGGGLKSNRKKFDAEEYLLGARRPPRVRQQYIGFAEDMMLILFLVCILATLVTVHRAACYRQIQDARRNTPLRHILPIAEDRPPPYTGRSPDSADGLSAVVCESSGPKTLSEAPPPSYEEALVRQPGDEDTQDQAEQEGMMESSLGREVEEHTNTSHNVQRVSQEARGEDLLVQSHQDVSGESASGIIEVVDCVEVDKAEDDKDISEAINLGTDDMMNTDGSVVNKNENQSSSDNTNNDYHQRSEM